MQIIATLCGIVDDRSHKIIAISPESDKWFVNAEDLTGEYRQLVRETEADGKVTVLGILFGKEEFAK